MTEPDIQSALTEGLNALAACSDSARLDAEILLCQCLNKPRTFLRAWPEKQLEEAQCKRYRKLISLRRKGTPIAYITGNREFWSRDFTVSNDVLIPRPETELLIELSLDLIAPDQSVKLIDLGTGSGIIAVTLAAERPHSQVTACDISKAALEIARQNATRHHTRNISFQQSSWFSNIIDTSFDLIISNPPYIAADDPHLHRGDVQHEPQQALISAKQGLEDIALIIEQGRQHLKAAGHLLIEHGYNQRTAVQAIFNAFNYINIITYSDLSGNPRVTSGIWKP